MLFLVRNCMKEASLSANKSYFCANWKVLILQQRLTSDKARAPVQLGSTVQRREGRQGNGDRKGSRRGGSESLSRRDKLDINTTDWPSVYDGASAFNYNIIPLEIRMGRPRHKTIGDVPPNPQRNVELLKVPNFFHLTPPAIKRHCEALKDHCLPWPENLPYQPIRITTINHIYSGPSIRHPDSRFVKLQIYLRDLNLDDHAYRKFVLLAGDRYNPNNGELTLITDKCPTRKQNKDYAYYLLTALHLESIKTEPWEAESIGMSEGDINREVEKVRRELYPNYYKEVKHRQRRYHRVINGKLVRFNRQGHPFVYEIRKHGIKGGLSEAELKLAKEEWKDIQNDLPDTNSFDPPYKPNFSSEFDFK